MNRFVNYILIVMITGAKILKALIAVTFVMFLLVSESHAGTTTCLVTCKSEYWDGGCEEMDTFVTTSWPAACPPAGYGEYITDLEIGMDAAGWTLVYDVFPTEYWTKTTGVCSSPRYPAGWASFTDPTITVGSTKIRATHITDLRTDINLMRADAGLAACSWTDPTISASSTKIRKVHFDEMRTCISQVYTTCGYAAPTFTDASITAGSTKIRAVHLNELRTFTQNAP